MNNPRYAGVFDISAEELKTNLESVNVVDVRQPEEYEGELGHIPNSELFVLDQLADNVFKIPKGKPLVIVCRSGARSAQAAAFLQDSGFQNVFNLQGGMIRWNELGYEIEK